MTAERYCTCQTVWEIPCPVHAELTPPAKKWLAKVKAEAWAEGYRAGNTRMNTYPPTEPTNPYREDT